MNRQSDRITAIYTRIDHPGNPGQIERQQATLQQYAEEQGFTNICHYSDNGFSGLSFSRPQFTEMMAAVKTGKIGVLLVSSLDRLTRNGLEAEYLMETVFPQHKIAFYALREGTSPEHPALPIMHWADMLSGGAM